MVMLQVVKQSYPVNSSGDDGADHNDDDMDWTHQPLSSLIADVQQTRAE